MRFDAFSVALGLAVVGASVALHWRRKQATIDSKTRRNIELKVSHIIELIQNEEWSELRRRFTPVLRLFLSATILRKGWQLVSVSTGPIQHVGKVVVSAGWFATVKVHVHFKRCNLAMVLPMTSSGSLLGLRFEPLGLAGLSVAWNFPTYATAGTSREEHLKLGKENKVEAIIQLPKDTGSYPCVIFLAGSGPADKDSTIGSLKPFKDLALGLAEQRIASIRFDKITLTHAKRFRRMKSFTLVEEYMEQALDAIRKAQCHPEIDEENIYILGHSLGAVPAARLASTNSAVKGCIIMAGPAEPFYHAYVRQLRYFALLDGGASEALKEQIDKAEQAMHLADSSSLNSATPSAHLPFGLPSSYWIDYHAHDPVAAIDQMDKPVLCLQGTRDYQVDPVEDYARWVSVLKMKQKAEMHLYEGLNHVFVKGEGQSTPAEYDLSGNVDEAVVRDVSRWVLLPH
ncbi:Esterase EstD [Paramyrothecium foliicola]|nr:Esterase EstD [Paramyrothecium foliicola]